MTDEDNTLAFASELVHDGEQALNLDVSQRSGRLVQNQQFCTVVQCLQDFHALLCANGNVSDLGIQLNVQAITLGQLHNLLPACSPVDEDALGVLVTQNDVIKNSGCFNQHEVLMHHANAKLNRLAGRLDLNFLAIQENLTLGGLIKTDQDVHQRGLTSAVFTQQRQNFAAIDSQIDVFIGVEITESLTDMFHPH